MFSSFPATCHITWPLVDIRSRSLALDISHFRFVCVEIYIICACSKPYRLIFKDNMTDTFLWTVAVVESFILVNKTVTVIDAVVKSLIFSLNSLIFLLTDRSMTLRALPLRYDVPNCFMWRATSDFSVPKYVIFPRVVDVNLNLR